MERRTFRILIVDDDPAVRAALAEVLIDAGYDVDEARGGLEALLIMRERLPDLVLLDLVMPDVSGWDVLSAMAASSKLANVAVVVLSAVDTRQELPAGHRALHKPIERDLMLEVVRSTLERGHDHDVTERPLRPPVSD